MPAQKREVTAEELREKISKNEERLAARVDCQGMPLTDQQISNLKTVIELQIERLEGLNQRTLRSARKKAPAKGSAKKGGSASASRKGKE